MSRPSALPLAATVLVLLATSFSVRAATPKACDLLSAQTATSLLGTAVGAGIDSKAGAACTYSSKSGDATVALGVGEAPTDGAQTVIALQMMTSKEPGTTTKSIPGLGEQSFLATRTSNKNAILLVYHQKILTLAVHKPMTAALETAMIQTVRQVLAKL